LTVKALKDFLPLDASLAIKTVRHDTLKVAERLEAELGEEYAGVQTRRGGRDHAIE
jgi:hypothetical protein